MKGGFVPTSYMTFDLTIKKPYGHRVPKFTLDNQVQYI